MKKKLLPLLTLLLITVSLCYSQTPVLWGMTSEGGHSGYGTVFSYTGSPDTENLQYSFDSIHGELPVGPLLKAGNGLLYGAAFAGGAHQAGAIFSYDITDGDYADLYDFSFSDTAGNAAYGALIQGSDSLLYGLTLFGGANFDGTIYSYNITTGQFTDLHDFGGDTDGVTPGNALVQASNGLLYGMTATGGSHDSGTIFSYNISDSTETVIHSFSGDSDGAYPVGALIQVNDSMLYGMTANGGTYDTGIIFSYNISSGVETVLYNFGSVTDGSGPQGALKLAGNGLLYGLTANGGISGLGTIFSYNISSGHEKVLYSFDGGIAGSLPLGSLIQAGDSVLYGMTSTGGTYNSGTIFSYNITGDSETVLHSFNIADGQYPLADLIQIGVITTAIQQPASDTYKLQSFPNPSTGQFTIQLPGGQSNYPVEIYNVLGEKIYESVLSSGFNTIDLGSEAAGMYVIYLPAGQTGLHSDEGTETAKVMIAR